MNTVLKGAVTIGLGLFVFFGVSAIPDKAEAQDLNILEWFYEVPEDDCWVYAAMHMDYSEWYEFYMDRLREEGDVRDLYAAVRAADARDANWEAYKDCRDELRD